jgi:hypothetical protein
LSKNSSSKNISVNSLTEFSPLFLEERFCVFQLEDLLKNSSDSESLSEDVTPPIISSGNIVLFRFLDHLVYYWSGIILCWHNQHSLQINYHWRKIKKWKKVLKKKMKKKQNYNVEIGSVVFYDKDAYKKFKKSVKRGKEY